MAKKLQQHYTFDPTLKKVFIRGIVNIDQLLLINNVTRGKILFALGNPVLGVASLVRVEKSNIFVDGHNLERHTEIILSAPSGDFTGMLSTDDLQIFTEVDHVKIEPSDTYTDPVMKMRVSTPENLIDTDFEYGLQATKWETLETLNNIPAFFITNAETSLGDIFLVTSVQNSRIVTVDTVAAHGLTPGAPFEIRGLNEITAEGTYLVKAVPSSTSFTYEASDPQPATVAINNSYTVIFPGQFYSASQITINTNTGAGITTDNAIDDSTLVVNTKFPHGFPVTTVNPASFYIVNAIAGKTSTFDPQDTAADGRPVVDFANTFNIDKTFRAAATANGFQHTGVTSAFVSEPIAGLQTTPQLSGYRSIESQNFEPNGQISVPSSQSGVSNQTALPSKPAGYAATEHYLKNLYFDFSASSGTTTDIIAGTFDPGTGATNNTQGFFRFVNHGFRNNDLVWLTVGPNANQTTTAVTTNIIANNQLYFVRRIDADRFALKNFVDARTTLTIPGTVSTRSTMGQNPNPVIVTRVGTTTVVTLTCSNTASSATLTTTNTSQANVFSLGYGDFNNNLQESPSLEGAGATYTITPGMYLAGDQQLDAGIRTTAIQAFNRVISVSANTITLNGTLAANTNKNFFFFRMFGLFMFQEAASDPVNRNSATKINRLVPASERFIVNNHFLADNTRVALVRLPAFTTTATGQKIGAAVAGTDISGNTIQEIDATNSAAIALGAQVQPDPNATTRSQHAFYYNVLINGSNVYFLRRIGNTENNNEVTGKNLNCGLSQIPNGPILSIEGAVDGNFLLLPIVDNPRANQIFIPNHGFQENFFLQYNINNPGTIANNLIRGTSLSNTAVRIQGALANGTSYRVKVIDSNYIQLKTAEAESTIINLVSNGSNATTNTLHRLFNVAQENALRDTIFIPGHSISKGTPVQYNAPVGETPIGGLTSGSTFFVNPVNNNRIRLQTGPTTTTFVDFTAAGVGDDHELVDQSSVGSIDGVYEHNTGGGDDTELIFNTQSTINGKKVAFDPTKVVDCFVSGFLIKNHGFLTGTIVTYKNPNGGNDIVPLTNDDQYKIVKLSNNGFSLTEMDGTPIILQSPGSGTSPAQPHTFISNAVSGEITGPGVINLTFTAKEFNAALASVVDIGNDSFTITSHGYFAAFSVVSVKYEAGSGTPIGGLTSGSLFFVGRAVKKPGRNDTNDFSLYRTANDAQFQRRDGIVDLTSLGSGTHKLVTGSTIVNLLANGTVIPTFKGNYVISTVFQHGDIVQYRGDFHIAQAYTANINPTTTAANIFPNLFEDATTSVFTQNPVWKKINTPLGPDPKFRQNFKVGDSIRISLDYPEQTLNGISRVALSGTTVLIGDDRFSTGVTEGGHGLVIGESVKFTAHRMSIVGSTQAAPTVITTVTTGAGYTTHPLVVFSPPLEAPSPTTALAAVRTRVQFIEITNGGTNYSSNPTVTIAAAGGTAATGTAVVVGNVVTGVTITSEGINMTSVPTVTFTGGGGSGAVAFAVMKVQDAVIGTVGVGYHEVPSMTFSEPSGSANVAPVPATGTTKLSTPFISNTENLVPGQIYYARPISNQQFELYFSREDADTGTNKIDFTTTGAGDIVFLRRFRTMRFNPFTTTAPAVPVYPNAGVGFMAFPQFQIKFSGVHGMANGDLAIYNQNFNTNALDGLTNFQTLFVRAVDLNTITLHPTRQNALDNTNIIEFTNAGIVGTETHFLLHRTFQEQFVTKISGITTNNNLFLEELPSVGLVNCEYTVPTSIFTRPDGFALHRPFDGGIEMSTSASPFSKIVRQTRRYFRYQSGKGIQTSVAINFNPPIEIQSITSAGTLATVTSRKPHGLLGSVTTVKIDDALNAQGTKDSNYNGTFVITNTGLRTFTYVMPNVPASNTASGFPFANVTQGQPWGSATRTGMMDDQNGIYFEYDGEKIFCCKRSSVQQLSGRVAVTQGSSEIIGTNCQFTRQVDVSGTIVIRGQTYVVVKVIDDNTLFVQPEYRGSSGTRVEVTKVVTTKIPQENWNIDPCDGSGPHGFILDIDKIQMVYIDYSWYGAGKVRFGFKDDEGHLRYVHEFKHNNKAYESYLRSGNLPARYEIEAGADPQYIPTLFHWGTSVIMDGRFDDDKGYLITGGSDDLSIQIASAGFFVPLVSLRLAPSVDSSLTGPLGERDVINRMQVTPNQLSLLSSQAGQIFLFLNGQLTSPSFSTAGNPSLSQIVRHSGVPTSDGIVGGISIFESRVQANQSTTIDLSSLTTIGNSILGGDEVYPNGPDILTVCVRYKTLTVAATVSATLSWTESQA